MLPNQPDELIHCFRFVDVAFHHFAAFVGVILPGPVPTYP